MLKNELHSFDYTMSSMDYRGQDLDVVYVPDVPSFQYTVVEKREIISDEDRFLTQMAMEISSLSLAEDWNSDADNHWDTFKI